MEAYHNYQNLCKVTWLHCLFSVFHLHRSGCCIIYTVSQKNVPHLASYNFDAHELILKFFVTNVTDKEGIQKTLYYATSNNLCFCTTWRNAETRKSHFTQLCLCYTHNAPVCYLPERKKLSSVMCLIACNIC